MHSKKKKKYWRKRHTQREKRVVRSEYTETIKSESPALLNCGYFIHSQSDKQIAFSHSHCNIDRVWWSEMLVANQVQALSRMKHAECACSLVRSLNIFFPSFYPLVNERYVMDVWLLAFTFALKHDMVLAIQNWTQSAIVKYATFIWALFFIIIVWAVVVCVCVCDMRICCRFGKRMKIVALVLQSRTAVRGIRFEFFQLKVFSLSLSLASNDVVVTLISSHCYNRWNFTYMRALDQFVYDICKALQTLFH